MGREKAEYIDDATQKRREYRMKRYHRTRDELLNAQATLATYDIANLLGVALTPQQTQAVVDYIKEHFKMQPGAFQ